MRLLHPVSQIVIFVATRASDGALHCCTNQNYHTMKRFILLLAAVACAVSCTSKEPFTIGKGVNISHTGNVVFCNNLSDLVFCYCHK